MAKEQIQIAITDAYITEEQRRNKREIAARYQELTTCKMQAWKVILYVQAKSIFLVGIHLSYPPVRCTLIVRPLSANNKKRLPLLFSLWKH